MTTTRSNRTLGRVRALTWRSIVYPVTASYLAAITVIMLITSGVVSFTYGATALALASILIILTVVRRDLNTVHELVNSSSDAQQARIEQLIEALNNAGVAVPLETVRVAR